MPINRINTNFKGIYRIPYSEESVQELKQNLLPTYINVTNQKAKFFVGRHPFFDSFKVCHKIIADENNSSVEWLKMNAQNHGAKAKDFDEEFIYVISGEKDLNALNSYIEDRVINILNVAKETIKEKYSILSKIKKLFIGEKNNEPDSVKNAPEHLKFLFYLIDTEKKETKAFEEFAPQKIESKNTKDLFIKMMQER